MNREAWQEEAYAALRRWARYIRDFNRGPMTIERARALMHVSPPGDERWWGPVVQRALREKIIRRKGYGRAKSSHNAVKATYVGTRYA